MVVDSLLEEFEGVEGYSIYIYADNLVVTSARSSRMATERRLDDALSFINRWENINKRRLSIKYMIYSNKMPRIPTKSERK